MISFPLELIVILINPNKIFETFRKHTPYYKQRQRHPLELIILLTKKYKIFETSRKVNPKTTRNYNIFLSTSGIF